MYGCEQTTDGRGRPSSLVLPRHSTSPSTPFTTTWQRPKCTECFRRVFSSGTLCSCVWGSGSSAGLWVTLALGCLFSESSRESKATRRCVRYMSYERVVGAASCHVYKRVKGDYSASYLHQLAYTTQPLAYTNRFFLHPPFVNFNIPPPHPQGHATDFGLFGCLIAILFSRQGFR